MSENRLRADQIIRKRARQHLTILVIDEMLEKCATEPLDDGADRLTMQGQRIDDPACILDRHVVDDVDVLLLGIHRDVRDMAARWVCLVL